MTATTPMPICQSRGQYLVPSKSEIGLVHVVRECRGEWVCDCHAAVNGLGCWHKREVEKVLRAELAERKALLKPGLDLLMGRTPQPAA